MNSNVIPLRRMPSFDDLPRSSKPPGNSVCQVVVFPASLPSPVKFLRKVYQHGTTVL